MTAQRLAAMRIVVGAYAVIYTLARLPELVAAAQMHRGSWSPLGIARVLHEPLPPGLAIAVAIITVPLLGLFASGFAYRIVAPLAAIALLWTMTYRNSWGQPFHTENLLVLHVIALACAPAADAWAWRMPSRAIADDRAYAFHIRVLAVITVSTYVLAGIAKLRLAGGAWTGGEQLRNQIAMDNARKVLLGAAPSFIATPLLGHPSLFTGVSIATLIVELGAPLALIPRIGRVWVWAAWGFHVGVLLLMNIVFPYPLFGVAFVPWIDVAGMFRRVRRSQV
ncbi:MAG TPA: hypothetical protein VGC41_24240 [Kofleriaceae bacterium]